MDHHAISKAHNHLINLIFIYFTIQQQAFQIPAAHKSAAAALLIEQIAVQLKKTIT